ncbi:unnamed protein product [Acanthoscelides obtectus]|uniref:Uncharacterized protein n=1 Tax=Acanthoscelides obtectus TaxID=200917 RepID=A0A9P0VTK7_ACAOB|nr:unnamed protein product [Acanthoscelides obtectus]CAK1674307.1 hypothetical protein AOBTE_LOCUS29587 [Acanthoscelides obtectus]
MDFDKDPTLQEWTREQPLSVLALDSADRAVLRIAETAIASNTWSDISCIDIF